MDKRTKILAGFFGLAIFYVLVSGVIYPRWIKKWLTIDDEIVKREAELAELQALDDRVTKAKYGYREYMGRAGDNDISHVMTDVRERLNKLIDKHILIDAKVTPSRTLEDRKTGLQSAVITVSAGGPLSSAIEFIRDASELPHLVRIGNVVLSPSAGSSRRDVVSDMLNIRVPIEVWVLPDHQLVGRLQPEDLVHPEFYVRHQGRDYARIWSGEPFQEYVPLVADLPPSFSVQKGQPVQLEVAASGGRGEYTFTWTPSEGLSDPQKALTRVDTSAPGTKRYTVTVADASGHSAQATATVTITQPPPPPPPNGGDTVASKPPPPPPPRGPEPWKDGQYKELRMALLRSDGNERLDEFMLYDNRTREISYYKVGDEFDGGQLIYVHQTGGVARRSNEYYVYPLGLNVAQSLPLMAAEDYPELQRAAAYHRNALQELGRAASKPAAAAPGAAPGGPIVNKPQGDTAEAGDHLLDAPKEEIGPPEAPAPATGVQSVPVPGEQAVPSGEPDTGDGAGQQPTGAPKPAGDPKRRPPRKSR